MNLKEKLHLIRDIEKRNQSRIAAFIGKPRKRPFCRVEKQIKGNSQIQKKTK